MKKLLLAFSLMICIMLANGQTPNKFNYQAVIRNQDGKISSNSVINMTFKIYDTGTGALVFEESQSPTTNQFGLINVVLGELTPMEFSWTGGPYQLEILVDGTTISSAQILAVPYALAAGEVVNKDDADADPSNELQDLQFDGNVLTITGNPDATPITIPVVGEGQWLLNGDSVSITGKNVGIGTSAPMSQLVVMGDGAETPEEALFEVKKADGNTVFAVYNDGAELYVNNSGLSGIKSGFIVKSVNPLDGISDEYLRVTPDSVRIYIDDNPGVKGLKGGFAVGGYNSAKGTATNFMSLTPENYFIGHESGLEITTGEFNSTLGYQAGSALTEGNQNIFVGYQSGTNTTVGDQNIFFGYQSGFSNSTGFENTFMGYRTGYFNTSGHNNLFLGYEAGHFNTLGSFNMFMGYRAGTLNTTGESNMFIGNSAGIKNTTGNYNLFIGTSAGFENSIGNRNIFIGVFAGKDNVSGSSNLFFGQYAGQNNTEGASNIYIGTSTGASNTVGSSNVFVGDQSGTLNTSGAANLLLGYQAGFNNSIGSNNTIMGFEAGFDNNGSNNVYIGSQAGTNNHGDGNIFIGTGAAGLESSVSNMLVIDNTIGIAADNALISGKLDNPRHVKFTARVGIWRTPEANRFELEGDASKTIAGDWLANSDMRIKTEIEDILDAYEVMLRLRPVKFRYTDEYMAEHPDISDRVYYNFLAQEYREVFPEAVQSSGEILPSENDEILQMDSYNAQIYSIKAVQDLIRENQQQKKQIEELYDMIRELKDR